jgi:putative transposase
MNTEWQHDQARCLFRTLQVLRTHVDHYNHARPHRGLELAIPQPIEAGADLPHARAIDRRNRIGGLIHEYYRAA